MDIKSDPNHAAFQTRNSLSFTEELKRQIMRGVWMTLKKPGEQWKLPFPRLLLLLAMTSIGSCAQIEMYRLQGEVDELQEQLAYEKQRLKQASELADSNPNQPVKQRKSAKVCKPHTKKGVDTRSSNCASGRKVVK
ncbi:MAG: hypothetical protein NTX45_09635 [Proteobacteria bacterium]|nr:hypothetical protein [Pseudomonadota bacterium]